ncbi:MAG: FlaA1/EpsC-like NDP-sugar epimerase [Hydrogenophaga sp.]|jgi:FlaA1/EpsC-like NDP-sugar epimerase
MPPHPLSQWLLSMPRPLKRALALALDACFCVLTVWLALYLRLEAWVGLQGMYLPAVFGSIALALPIFVRAGLYRTIFRHAGWHAMVILVKAMALYSFLYAGVFTLIAVPGIPRTVGIIQPLLLLVAVGSSRMLVSFFLGDLYRRILKDGTVPAVLIYGAGSAGRQLASGLRKSREQRLVGFLDDDSRLHGNTVDGLTVFPPEKLGALIERSQVQQVLLAVPSLKRSARNAILHKMRRYAVHVRTLPGMSELASGLVSLKDLQELDTADILGRDAVAPDVRLLNQNIRGKVVLVTGAGGSIGSELCRQVMKCAPARLLLVDMNEFALYQIHQELSAAKTLLPLEQRPKLIALLASVQDERRMDDIISAWQPHTLYHAAAYKHVPLVEHNPAEGLRNNVWGTLTCARVAARHGVQSFVLVSTDKAVRPTNIMGASKRLAELVIQAYADAAETAAPMEVLEGASTCFCVVRFGNVLGSSGSVVPLFRQQIEQGGPITLTHADVTRYFMTISEASELVIQAGAMASGGDVFVLDMGEPVRIYDLAQRMVELAGLRVRDAHTPHGQIEIQVTGLRPGEKLFEELLIGDDPHPTELARVMKAREHFLPWSELEAELAELDAALKASDLRTVRLLLQRLTGYTPEGAVVDWVENARSTKPPSVVATGW